MSGSQNNNHLRSRLSLGHSTGEPQEEINSTYRSIYGGPSGLSATSWTSRSSAGGTTSPSSASRSVSKQNSLSASGPTESGGGGGGGGNGGVPLLGRTTSIEATSAAAPVSPPPPPYAKTSTPFTTPPPTSRSGGLNNGGSPGGGGGGGGGVRAAGISTSSPPLVLGGGGGGTTTINSNVVSKQPVLPSTSSNSGLQMDSGTHRRAETNTNNNTNITNNNNGNAMARAERALAAARQQIAASSSHRQKSATDVTTTIAATTTTATTTTGIDATTTSSAPAPKTTSNNNNNSSSNSSSGLSMSTTFSDGVNHGAVGASNKAPALVSQLTTGTAPQQLDAAKTLTAALKQHGDPVQRATHQAGGTHMLQNLLRTGNPQLQEACAGALAEMTKYHPALEEVTATQDTPLAIVHSCLTGISAGNEAYTNLFVGIVASENDSVKAACAAHKGVRVLADILTDPQASTPSKRSALTALEALCTADPAHNLKKLAWGGGLAALVPLVEPPSSPTAASALSLLLLALEQDPYHAESLAYPGLIEALAVLIADPDVALPLQVGAARVLAAVAALRTRTDDATQALNDFALPRACEVLHQVESIWSKGAPSVRSCEEAPLHAACAVLVAYLCLGSELCCHVVLFHAEALRTVASVLTGSHEFGLVEAVLGATGRYAAQPTAIL